MAANFMKIDAGVHGLLFGVKCENLTNIDLIPALELK